MRRIVLSEDGSNTIYVPGLKEHYHSTHGALQESQYIFIEKGLSFISRKELSILEIGFGTGLNSLLSLIYSIEKEIRIDYTGIEKYPLVEEEWSALNFSKVIGTNENRNQEIFRSLHTAPWGLKTQLNSGYSLTKIKMDVKDLLLPETYDLVYFDAFAPNVQPELWTIEVFSKIYTAMNKNALLLTYSSKGSVRRTLENCGFRTDRLPGPPGKREIMRAIK